MLRIDAIIREQLVKYFLWAFDMEFREFPCSLYWAHVALFGFGNEVKLLLYVLKFFFEVLKLIRNSNVPKCVLSESCLQNL